MRRRGGLPRGVAGAEARASAVAGRAPAGAGGTRSLRVEVAPGRPVQAELHRLVGPAEDHLVLFSDPRALEAVEVDARLERQIDGLGRVYRTLAHELRAPLSAMLMSLDLLQESLSREGEAPLRRGATSTSCARSSTASAGPSPAS